MSESPRSSGIPAATPGQTIRARGLMDFTRDLDEAATRLEVEARRLRRLHELGWRLQGNLIDNDLGVLVDPNGNVRCLECGTTGIPETDALCEACSQLESPLCPECRQGKHGNCTGEALNIHDELVPCACGHTQEA